ncbi:MAG: heavy metal translocating P-type ATPase [Bacteriovorax sp.]|nr:heavy metal translocating P-type ATPase [Bacteriovorax sp.]
MNNSKIKTYKIEGMTCASCSQIIEENVRKLSGVDSVQVNFVTEKAELAVGDSFQEEIFSEMLNKLGYRALSSEKVKEVERAFADKSFFNIQFFQSALSLLVGIFSMALAMGPFSKYADHQTNNSIQFVLSTLILLLFGKVYVKSVYHFFTTRYSNMNTLIGLGVLAAYFYSLILMFFSVHAHVYFETIPFIIGFTLFGHFLEEKAKTKAKSSLSSLYKMQIKFASKVVEGVEVNTPVIDLKVGNTIRLRPGDKIPLDGIVSEGSSHTDESMITGESSAVSKKIGDNVFAGSLNLEGSLLIKVQKEIHQGFISDVVAYVEKAQLRKAPIQKYADKIVQYFVPTIIIISLFTFLIWMIFNPNEKTYQAFSHMIAVLLIACPCALGLAVPMAVMITTAEASKSGLLIGGGEVIERASTIDIIVFDKTGTLTEGHPNVIDYESSPSIDESEFFRVVGSITRYSSHPLSHSITQFIEARKIKLGDPDKFKNIPGYGVESFFEGKRVLVGNAEFLKREKIEICESEKVGSLVYISIDQSFAGVFVIADPLKKEAKETIASLKRQGIEVWMLTGDNQKIARKIATELGIVNFKDSVLPVEKADFILALQENGKKVAMIGDGINDAPALSSANLSMAMSSGSDVAIEASDVSILEGKIACVAQFFERSNKTMRVIKQNLFLSFFYNLLCIPLAAGLLYPLFQISLTPMWASLAMGLSSLSVILSSLRLKKSL